MHDVEPGPCTPAGFRTGWLPVAKPGLAAGDREPGAERKLRVSLGGTWLLDVPALAVFLCLGGFTRLGSGGPSKAVAALLEMGAQGVEVALIAGAILLAAMLRERDVDLTLLPSGLLSLQYQSALRQRGVTIPIAEVRAVGIVEEVGEDSRTWRTRLLTHGTEHLDLGVVEGTAARLAAFLQLPLERHPHGEAPFVLGAPGATPHADA